MLPPNFSVDTSVPPPSIPALEFSKSPEDSTPKNGGVRGLSGNARKKKRSRKSKPFLDSTPSHLEVAGQSKKAVGYQSRGTAGAGVWVQRSGTDQERQAPRVLFKPSLAPRNIKVWMSPTEN